jgi:hypothetical protein
MEWLKRTSSLTGNISYLVYSSDSLNFSYVLFALLHEQQVENMKPNSSESALIHKQEKIWYINSSLFYNFWYKPCYSVKRLGGA